MNEQKIAKELVAVAKELTAELGVDRSTAFKGVFRKLEALRQKYDPTSDEAIFLGMVRDMALYISKDRWSSVKALGMDIQSQLEAGGE